MRLLVIILVTFLQPITVLAGEGAGSLWGTITEVNINAEGTVLRVRFSNPIVNPSNCEGHDFYIRELDDSMASDRFVRMVMAALLANAEVEFWIDGCTKSRWWGKTQPQIYDIYVRH